MPERSAESLGSWARQGRRRFAYALILLIGLPAGAFLLGQRLAKPPVVEVAAPPIPVVTAPLVVRTLEVAPAWTLRVERTSASLAVHLNGEGVVTEAPVAGTLQEGQVIATIGDRPVFVLRGELPLIADVGQSARGSLVHQLQESLARLGLYEGDLDGVFGPRTARAVKDLYLQAGFDAPEAASPELGTTTSSGSLVLDPAELVFLPQLPVDVASVVVHRGDVISDGPLLDYYVGPLALVMEVDSSTPKANLLVPGLQVWLASASGVQVGSATLTELGEAESEDAAVIIAEFALDGTTSVDVGARVDAYLDPETQATSLAAPITAVRYEEDGTPYVLVANGAGVYTKADVQLGLSSQGFVALEDTPLAEGTEVVVGDFGIDQVTP